MISRYGWLKMTTLSKRCGSLMFLPTWDVIQRKIWNVGDREAHIYIVSSHINMERKSYAMWAAWSSVGIIGPSVLKHLTVTSFWTHHRNCAFFKFSYKRPKFWKYESIFIRGSVNKLCKWSNISDMSQHEVSKFSLKMGKWSCNW